MCKWIKNVWVLLPTLFFSCQQNTLTVSVHPVYESLPASWPEAQYVFPDRVKQYHWFELGRQLFYDPILSADSSISCASCHKQEHAFADSRSLSLGVNQRSGRRNSPALQNLAFSPFYMMDGGILHLETMPLAPITDSLEMNMSLANLIARLNRQASYKRAFEAITLLDSIRSKDLLLALTAFQSGIHNFHTLYDSVQAGLVYWENEIQEKGAKIFESKCASCHTPPLFTDFSFANNGYNDSDIGRALISDKETDRFKLKVPSLRNIADSSPYMHDGGISTLDEVLAHYRNLSRESSQYLDPRLHNLSLSAEDVEALKHFLRTLTDHDLLKNPFYSAPK